ncbi:malonate decarboxylase holo-ACP synthase [Solibacillus sp. FSL K6-1523]|uniref:malonate decarboxylase holo-ACP synthase n=1 Tax=Solibacillus sp. FSL K6-1523 TaxID=2921471 RepID=UPI0030F7CCF1
MVVNVHDIVFLYSNEEVEIFEQKPHWMLTDEMANRIAVVRRLKVTGEKVAIGFRGNNRSKRFAAFTSAQNIERIIKPVDVLQFVPPVSHEKSIKQLKEILQHFEWGIGGSVGFSMATGIQVCHEQSDIDVIIYMDSIAEVSKLETLKPKLSQCENKLDIQIEMKGLGGVVLDDVLNNEKFIVRTSTGPILIEGMRSKN